MCDSQAAYSSGWIRRDERHPIVVWFGTGGRNSQRSVAYGDGVYKSEDGGGSWTRVGLNASEHIGRIVISPKDSDTVYVAAQGPLWAAGGDRDDAGTGWRATGRSRAAKRRETPRAGTLCGSRVPRVTPRRAGRPTRRASTKWMLP